LKPKDGSKDILEFAEAEITLVQYILFTVEKNVIHQRSKLDDPSMVPNPHRFGPPTSIPRRHHRKEEEAPHLRTRGNNSKS
jgi:hypothetical protein